MKNAAIVDKDRRFIRHNLDKKFVDAGFQQPSSDGFRGIALSLIA